MGARCQLCGARLESDSDYYEGVCSYCRYSRRSAPTDCPHCAAKDAEIATIRERIAKLEGEIRIKEDYATSRLCSDHNGKWERGRCVLCELEHERERVERLEYTLKKSLLVSDYIRREGILEVTHGGKAYRVYINGDWVDSIFTDAVHILGGEKK